MYLDTGPGGTRQVFTPYATPENGTVISLPARPGRRLPRLGALVRGGDAAGAGTAAWSEVKALGAGEFRFDASRRDGQTDLYLPFELLGLSPASSLGLLALASEEPAEGSSLELWATLPLANPVNSPKRQPLGRPGGRGLRLLALARLPLAGARRRHLSGRAPRHSDLEVTITADPAGASLSGLGNGLFWLRDPAPLAALPGERDYGVLPALHPPLADGQPVEYTVHYRNPGEPRGPGRAAGAQHRSARCGCSTRRSNWATSRPAARGKPPSGRVADRGAGALPVAGVKALVYDAGHAPGGAALEWIWVAHRVDRGAPENGRVELGRRIGADNLRLSGLASDEAGVQEVTVEVQGPNGARTDHLPGGPAARRALVVQLDAGRRAARRQPGHGAPAGDRRLRPAERVERGADGGGGRGAARGQLQCGRERRAAGRDRGRAHAEALRRGQRCERRGSGERVRTGPGRERGPRSGRSAGRRNCWADSDRWTYRIARPGGAGLRQPDRDDLGRGQGRQPHARSRWS